MRARGAILAAAVDNLIAPPLEGNVVVSQAEELDKTGDGDTTGKGSRQDKVVLKEKLVNIRGDFLGGGY